MKLLLENNISNSRRFDKQKLKWSVWNDCITIDEGRLVVFNTLSRNALLMETSELKEPCLYADEVVNTLARLGMVVDAGRDEKAEWLEKYQRGREDMSYLDLTILLTEDCQMRCVYCFEGSKRKRQLSDGAADSILRFLESRADTCRKLRVTWFGGEPLLAYRRLRTLSMAIMDFCNKHNIDYSADITTNGFALNEERCGELVAELNVKRFIITIDGLGDVQERRRPLASGKATFGIIWNNIETLAGMGAWVTVRMTIDKDNAADIPALLDAIAASKLKGRVGLAFCRTIDCNNTPDELSATLYTEAEFAKIEWQLIQYAHSLGLWRYQFPHTAPLGGCLRQGDIVIGVNGETYKCLDTVGNEQWIDGHIDITGKGHGDVPQWYEMWSQWNPLADEACGRCVLLPLCNGGCPHNALFADKKHGTDSNCPDWKANYRNQIKSLVLENHDNKTL